MTLLAMPEHRSIPLMTRFGETVSECVLFSSTFSVV